ncbi:hypothetical protein GE09DRAFT_978723 [Coniochaeta sp. 2T2.1]|nr:hypothetical protein GE09DRAFT_978723 [Coniochaeta sp. 2T2.1]
MADLHQREEDPPKDQVWTEIEETVWLSTKAKREREDREFEEAHEKRMRVEHEKQFNLWAERAEIVEKLERIDRDIRSTQNAIQFDLNGHREAVEARRKQREAEDARTLEVVKSARPPPVVGKDTKNGTGVERQRVGWPVKNGGTPTPTAQTPIQTQYGPPAQSYGYLHQQHQQQQQQQQPPPQVYSPEPRQRTETAQNTPTRDVDMPDAPSDLTGVRIVDSEGNLIGPVRKLGRSNTWVDHAYELELKRDVAIRPGRKFGPEEFDKMYDRNDNKATKYLSVFIQAAGKVHATPCVQCTKTGVFADCIRVTTSGWFPRCGNCEWNRQAGEGTQAAASAPVPPLSPVQTRSSSRAVSLTVEGPLPSGGFTAVNGSAAAKKTPPLPDTTPGEEVTPAKKPRGGSRKSLPDAPVPADKGETGDDAEDEEEGDTEEITKDSLVLADDGTVFTEPEIMRGVPLEKISPSHPYWDPAWPPLEDFITPTLMKWQEKYEKATVEMATQSSKYLANRQINRGNAVLKYLREGPIHPLQIIAKRFVTKKLFNYDTIHRLVQILDELLKFKIDVTPAQWVRHRLHQKFLEKGEDFSLDEEVDALYHDSKVRYIRKKSGFGNIGRPSGYKMKGDLTAPSSQKRKSRPAKRKAEGSPSPEQPEQFAVTGDAEPEPEQQSAPPTTAPPTNAPPPAEPIPERRTSSRPTSSRGRLLTPPPPTTISSYPANDLDYSGYTSADSFSRDPIYQHDWRVYQVKTGQMTSNPTVTQYYHWVERGGDGTEELTFEHQVLKDVAGKNVTWGVYKDPFDFHLRLSELVEVRWAADSQKMVAVTKKVEGVEWRGNVIVCFKRERTKRRFVSFMGRRGVKLVKGDGAEIERMWEEMQSQVLDGNDSE